MAQFVLLPCKVRRDRLVPVKGAEAVVWDWTQLRDNLVPLAPSDHPQVAFRRSRMVAKLRLLQPRCYVGTMVSARNGRLTTFLLLNTDRSNRIGVWLKKDPLLPTRFQTIYRVESVDWGDFVSTQEMVAR